MKHFIIAFTIVLFATPLFAVQPVSAPPAMPADLNTAWDKVGDWSCARNDTAVISLKVYNKIDAVIKRQFYLMTKNNDVVHQFEESVHQDTGERSADAYVKKTDGGWTFYDWRTERRTGEDAIRDIVGLTGQEFLQCARSF